MMSMMILMITHDLNCVYDNDHDDFYDDFVHVSDDHHDVSDDHDHDNA